MILARIVGTVVATRKDARLVANVSTGRSFSGGESALERAARGELGGHDEIRLTYRELTALIEDAVRSLK